MKKHSRAETCTRLKHEARRAEESTGLFFALKAESPI